MPSLPTLSDAQLAHLCQGARLLEQDAHGPKVHALADGRILKIFRRKRRLSSASWTPYAVRFARNAAQLQALDIPTLQVEQVFQLENPALTAALYQPLPGRTLRECARAGDLDALLLATLGRFIARLHALGITFRSLHMGNIVLTPSGELGLIDVADMRFQGKPLSLGQRARNLRHLSRLREDGEHYGADGWRQLCEHYLQAAALPPRDADHMRQQWRRHAPERGQNAAVPRTLLHPRHWPTWGLVALLWLVTRLPLALQLKLGQLLGLTLMLVARERYRIAQTNLALCFPELDDSARQALLRRTLIDNGIGLVETAMAWFLPPERFRSRVRFEGLPLLEQAAAAGRGVLLLGAHYTTLDLSGNLFVLSHPASVMYRRQKNPVFEFIMTRGRSRLFNRVVERDDMRGVIRAIRSGDVLWYAPDQDYGRKNSLFAPFFGVPAATITASTRILRMTGAVPLVYSHWREKNGHYVLKVEPLDNFPSGDELADVTQLNAAIEKNIRQHPSQYMWVHRRFKTRPEGEPRPYRERVRRKRRRNEELT